MSNRVGRRGGVRGGGGWTTRTQGRASACKSEDRASHEPARRDVGKRLTSESRSAPPDTAHAPYLKERTPVLTAPLAPWMCATTLHRNRVDFIFFDEETTALPPSSRLHPCALVLRVLPLPCPYPLTPFYLRHARSSLLANI